MYKNFVLMNILRKREEDIPKHSWKKNKVKKIFLPRFTLDAFFFVIFSFFKNISRLKGAKSIFFWFIYVLNHH